MDDVRKAFASANKVNAGLFSFNSKGACENCQGLGVVYTELAFMETVKTPCEVCGGKRFKEEVLDYKLNGKSIADVLRITSYNVCYTKLLRGRLRGALLSLATFAVETSRLAATGRPRAALHLAAGALRAPFARARTALAAERLQGEAEGRRDLRGRL